MNSQAQIAQVIDQARQSKDIDLQAAVAYAHGICMAIQTPPETSLEDLKLLLQGLQGADYEQLQREMRAALGALQRFCSSGLGQDYVPLFRRKEIRRFDPYQDPPAKGRVVNPPDRRQWDAVFLGSPEQYPFGVELWMERSLKSLIPAEMAADEAAVEWLRRDLLQRLTHSAVDDQIGSHYACLYRWVCPMRLQFAPSDLAELRQVAQDLELRIRQQRWDQLGLR